MAMQTRKDLLKVPAPWPKVKRGAWNANLIPERFKALALSGEFYESKVLDVVRR